jgi:hypothetical protein
MHLLPFRRRHRIACDALKLAAKPRFIGKVARIAAHGNPVRAAIAKSYSCLLLQEDCGIFRKALELGVGRLPGAKFAAPLCSADAAALAQVRCCGECTTAGSVISCSFHLARATLGHRGKLK